MQVGDTHREAIKIHDELTLSRDWMIVSILSETECLAVCHNYWGKTKFEVKDLEKMKSYPKKK